MWADLIRAAKSSCTLAIGLVRVRVESLRTAGGMVVTNPAVVVEVLRPSTEAYDRGEKLSHYQRIPSLHHVALHVGRRRDLR